MAKNNPLKFKDFADFSDADEFGKIFSNMEKDIINTFKNIGSITKKQLEAVNDEIIKLRESTKSIGFSRSKTNLEPVIKDYERLSDAQREIIQTMKGMAQSENSAVKSLSALKEEAKQLQKEYERLVTTENKNSEEAKKLSKELRNTKQQVTDLSLATKNTNNVFAAAAGSYNSLSLELTSLRKEFRNLEGAIDPVTGELNQANQEAVALNDRISQLDATLKKADKSIGQSFRNVGNYADSIIEAKNALDKQKTSLEQQVSALKAQERATGRSAEEQKQLRDELKKTNAELEKVNTELKGFGEGASNSIDGLFDQLTGLFTTGGLIAAGVVILDQLAGAFAALQEQIVQTNKELRITESITGLTGGKLDSLTAKIKATAKTFDKDFNEVLRATNALAQEFGVSQEEALEQINKGFAKSADLSGDYLDNLREYGQVFKNINVSLEDFNALNIASAQKGLFNDKVADAVKEIALRLGDLTPAQRKIIEGMGDVGDSIIETFQRGDKIEAIELLVREMNRLEDAGKDVTPIISNLGGGPLEDLGRSGREVIASFRGMNTEFTESEKRLLDLNEANEEYSASVVELSANFKSLGDNLSLMWTQISTVGVDALNALVGLFLTAEEKAKNFVDTLNTFSDTDLNEELKEVNKEIEKTARVLEATKKAARSSGQLGLTSTNQIELEQKYQGLLVKRDGIEKQLNKNLDEYRDAFIKHSERQEKTIEDTGELTQEQIKLIDAFNQATDTTLDYTIANYLFAKSLVDSKERLKELVKELGKLEGFGLAGKLSKDAVLLRKAIEETFGDDFLGEVGSGAEDLFDRIDKRILKHAENYKKAQEDKTKAEKEEEEKREAIREAAFDVSNELLYAISETTYQRYQQETEALQAKKNEEIAALEQTAAYDKLTTEQRAKAKDQIEQVYARKELQLKRQQAKRDKAMAMFQIILSTAQAIAEASPNPFLMAAAAAVGGIQLAVVASKPLPAFEKGTKNAPEGLAVVGEKGFELVERKGKFIQTNDGPQIMPLKKGDKVYTHQESIQMIKDSEKAMQMNLPLRATEVHERAINNVKFVHNNEEIIKKIALESRAESQKIVKAIKSQPIPSLARQADKLFDVLERKNSRKTYLNKYKS